MLSGHHKVEQRRLLVRHQPVRLPKVAHAPLLPWQLLRPLRPVLWSGVKPRERGGPLGRSVPLALEEPEQLQVVLPPLEQVGGEQVRTVLAKVLPSQEAGG